MAAGRHKRSIVWKPQPNKIAAFMQRCEDEALYGAAADGGKSDALVIEALRQVDVPHDRGLIVRKTYPQLSELIDKTMKYYRPAFPKARYNASSDVRTFPSGAKTDLGGAGPHAGQDTTTRTRPLFYGKDELTHFTWEKYKLPDEPQPTHRAGHGGVHAGKAHPGGRAERPDAEGQGDPGSGRPGHLQREPGREHCPDAGEVSVLCDVAAGRPHPHCGQDAAALPACI